MAEQHSGDQFPPGYYSTTIETADWISSDEDSAGSIASALVKSGDIRIVRATGFDGNKQTWLLVQVLRHLDSNLWGSEAGNKLVDVSGGSFGNSGWFPETSLATAETAIPEQLAEAAKPGLIDNLESIASAAQRGLDSAKSGLVWLGVLVFVGAVSVAIINRK